MENGLICFHLLKSRTCGLNEEFGDKVRESECPVCICKALDSWWLCKIVIAVSLWWVSVLARQGTECWKIQAAAWGAWSQTVHLNAWLEGLRLRPVCYCLCVLPSETAMVHAFLLVLTVLSVSIFLFLFLLLCLHCSFLWICLSLWVCVCIHPNAYGQLLYVYISLHTWNLGVYVLAWVFTCNTFMVMWMLCSGSPTVNSTVLCLCGHVCLFICIPCADYNFVLI